MTEPTPHTEEPMREQIALAYRLRGSVTKSGGIDLRDPELLHEAADALCDAAGMIFALSSSPSRESLETIVGNAVEESARYVKTRGWMEITAEAVDAILALFNRPAT